MLNKNIRDLVQYGIDTGLVPECERVYTTNLLLDVFQKTNTQSRRTRKYAKTWRPFWENF